MHAAMNAAQRGGKGVMFMSSNHLLHDFYLGLAIVWGRVQVLRTGMGWM